MLNYIIKQSDYKLYISIDHIMVIRDISFQKYLNQLLRNELVDLITRERCIKRLFNYKSKIPIYVNRGVLLMCIKSYRLVNSFYLNYHSIKNYRVKPKSIVVELHGNHSIKITQKHAFLNQIKKCREVIEFLVNKKMFTSM